MRPPCKGCPDRCAEPNCHMNCPHGYLEFRAERDALMNEKRENRHMRAVRGVMIEKRIRETLNMKKKVGR